METTCQENNHLKIYSKEGCHSCWYCPKCGSRGCDNAMNQALLFPSETKLITLPYKLVFNAKEWNLKNV